MCACLLSDQGEGEGGGSARREGEGESWGRRERIRCLLGMYNPFSYTCISCTSNFTINTAVQ